MPRRPETALPPSSGPAARPHAGRSPGRLPPRVVAGVGRGRAGRAAGAPRRAHGAHQKCSGGPPRWCRSPPDRSRAWLCEVVPGLGWEPPADPAEAWERGAAAERIDAVRRLRATDPAAARALLAAGLGGERADVRGRVLRRAGRRTRRRRRTVARARPGRSCRVGASRRGGPPGRTPGLGLVGPHGSARRTDGARGRAGRARPVRHPADGPPSRGWERDGIDPAAPPGTSLGVHVLRQVVAGTPLSWWEAARPRAAPGRAGR